MDLTTLAAAAALPAGWGVLMGLSAAFGGDMRGSRVKERVVEFLAGAKYGALIGLGLLAFGFGGHFLVDLVASLDLNVAGLLTVALIVLAGASFGWMGVIVALVAIALGF